MQQQEQKDKNKSILLNTVKCILKLNLFQFELLLVTLRFLRHMKSLITDFIHCGDKDQVQMDG